MRRNYLPLLTLLALLLALLAALPVGATLGLLAPSELETVAMPIDGTPLIINRPADWWEGGVTGLGIVHSYIGDRDGLPAFAVQHDPDSTLGDEAAESQVDAAVEELFDAIIAGRPGYHVDHAGWIRVNGLRAHSSLSGYSSVAGPLMVRRLIIVREGSPFIFAWTATREEWPAVAALVEACVASLRLRDTERVTD